VFVLPLLQWKSNKCYMFWVCVYSRRFLACKARAPYWHLWPFRLYNIFRLYLVNLTIFEKKVIECKMCVLIFSTNFFWNISYSKNWARYDHKCILALMCGTRYSCHVLTKIEFFGNFSEKYSHIHFNENRSSGSRVIPCGRTDGHTGMTKIIFAFRNFWTYLKISVNKKVLCPTDFQFFLAFLRPAWWHILKHSDTSTLCFRPFLTGRISDQYLPPFTLL